MRRRGRSLRRWPRGIAQQRLEAVGGVAARGLGGRSEGRKARGGLRGADDGRAGSQVVEIVLLLQALEGVDVGAVLDAEAAVDGGRGAGAGAGDGDGQARVVEVLGRGLRDDGQAGDEGGDDLGRGWRDLGTIPAAAGLAVIVSVGVAVAAAAIVVVIVVVVVVL